MLLAVTVARQAPWGRAGRQAGPQRIEPPPRIEMTLRVAHVDVAKGAPAGKALRMMLQVVERMGEQGDTAVRIRSLDKDGPAAKGRLVEGDVILSIDGRPVDGVDDLVRMLDGDKIGQAVVLSVLSPRGLETRVVLPSARS